jgi:hypothetical protein
MRFDPKLIPQEKPPWTADRELSLPDDFTELGGQLQEEAARLAAIFPPKQCTVLSVAGSASRFRSVAKRAVLSSLALVAIASAGVAVWRSGGGQPRTNDSAQAPILERGAAAPSSPGFSETTKSLGSGVSLAELSGPEWEAVLDLMESDSEPITGVSF